jgi:flavin-dependent dehydrogenase
MSLISPEYDVVVVGARVAGATTAMLLARRGLRVLLLDRSRLPSEIAQGHFVYRQAPRRLRDWGLLERILETDCPPVTSLTMDVGDFPLRSTDLSVDGVPWGIGPRRGVLDKILLEAAVDAGVEVHDQTAVQDVLTERGRVVGVRVRSAWTSAPTKIWARVVVGADGRHSRIAEAVRARTIHAMEPLTCWYFSYWSGVPMDGIELHVRQRRAMFIFPTNDHLTAVFVAFPNHEFARVRAHPESALMAALDQVPGLAERVRAGAREERMYGTADVPNFIRQAAGPGWALVGDAVSHKDPMLALGISHALQDAELLARSLHAGLSGSVTLDTALQEYSIERSTAAEADYRENLQWARLDAPTPEVLALRSALRDRPEDARLFALANFDAIPRERFFNPQTMARILSDGPASREHLVARDRAA